MNTHPLFWRGLIVLGVLVLVPLGVGVALAHGTPTIAVQPAVCAAGSPINVTGSDMEAGESFTITLDGMAGSTVLGAVSAAAEGEEAGFSVTYTVPAKTAPGSYTVRAIAEDGDGTTADLTVTAPSDQASADPAMVQGPSAAPHVLDRSKPIGEIAGVLVLAVVSGGVGAWLARPKAT